MNVCASFPSSRAGIPLAKAAKFENNCALPASILSRLGVLSSPALRLRKSFRRFADRRHLNVWPTWRLEGERNGAKKGPTN